MLVSYKDKLIANTLPPHLSTHLPPHFQSKIVSDMSVSPYNPPTNGHCFYECMAKVCRHNPSLQDLISHYQQELQESTGKGKRKIALHYVLRYMVSRNLTMENLNDYFIYHSCDPIEWLNENPNPSLLEFQNFIATQTEYANEITIQVFLNIFDTIGLIVLDEEYNIISLENWAKDKKEIYVMQLVKYEGDNQYHYKIWV